MGGESKVGRGKLSVEEKEQLARTVAEIKENEGTQGVKRFFLKRMMDSEDKETGGDDFLFWNEANAIDSAHRINSLDVKLWEFYGERSKLVAERCMEKGFPEPKWDQYALLAEMGVYSEESIVLHEEYVKSIAELCIKKMRLGALVDKRDKRTTLMLEIEMARKIGKEFRDVFTAFKNLLARKLQQENGGVGGAPAESPEIAIGQNKKLDSLNDVSEIFRVLVEMMRGVKVGQEPIKGLDDAMALGKRWCDAVIHKCVMKVWVGTLVERRSVFEVLESEIVENWKMEKEVKDRIFDYQRELALQGGFVTKVGPHPPHVEGDEAIKEKNSALTKAGRYAAVGMIAAFAELAIVKAKRTRTCMTAKLKVD